jgi:hypothetical protein
LGGDLTTDGQSGSERFRTYVAVAQLIAAEAPSRLVNLVWLLGRKVQYEALCGSLHAGRRPEAPPNRLFFSTPAPLSPSGRSLRELAVPVGTPAQVDLRTDLVLTCPWNVERLAAAPTHIGAGGHWARAGRTNGITGSRCGRRSGSCGSAAAIIR